MNAVSQPPSPPDPIRTREAGWLTIALYVGIAEGLLVLLIAIRRAGPLGDILAGSGWRENLFLFAVLLLVAVGGVIFGIGGLRPADVGLRRDKLIQALIVTVTVWSIMQLFAAVEDVATTGTIVIDSSWTRSGVGRTLAWTAAMFLGAALFEEISYRGFLFPQLYLKLRGTHRIRFWTALVVTQTLFAVGHIPAHISLRNLSGSALWTTVVVQGVAGVLLLLLYLRTRNLWISVGIHGLANAPTPLVAGAWGWETLMILLIVLWPWIARKPQHRGFARVEQLVEGSAAEGALASPETRMPAPS